MNKRISTLLTAGLLMVGALFGSANAAPTAEAAKGDLQNGAKFYLGNTKWFHQSRSNLQSKMERLFPLIMLQVMLLSKMLLCLKLLIMLTMQLVTFLRLH